MCYVLCPQVAQAVAHSLGISVDMVKVRPNLTYIVPNSSITGGSTTSERAVRVSCCSSVVSELFACFVGSLAISPIFE